VIIPCSALVQYVNHYFGGKMMKFFFWELTNKQKFIRSLWTGLIALGLLYFVVFTYGEGLLITIILPVILTIVYLIDLWYRYLKYKSNKE
jgi:hypothetical protein